MFSNASEYTFYLCPVKLSVVHCPVGELDQKWDNKDLQKLINTNTKWESCVIRITQIAIVESFLLDDTQLTSCVCVVGELIIKLIQYLTLGVHVHINAHLTASSFIIIINLVFSHFLVVNVITKITKKCGNVGNFHFDRFHFMSPTGVQLLSWDTPTKNKAYGQDGQAEILPFLTTQSYT